MSVLLAAPVGVELIHQLRRIDPVMVDDEARLLLAQLWERCVGWVTDQAAQACAVFIEAVTDPPQERAYHRRGVPVAAGVCLREVGVATGLSDAKAAMRILCGRALAPTGVLAKTGQALRAGRISPDVAHAFVDATLSLTPDQARIVQDLVLPRAVAVLDPVTGQGCWRSRTWAMTALRRAVITIDPDAVTRRRHHATQSRRIDVIFEHDTGMAYLTAYLPAAEAIEIRHALDALAAALRHHDITGSSTGDDTCGAVGKPRGWGATSTMHTPGTKAARPQPPSTPTTPSPTPPDTASPAPMNPPGNPTLTSSPTDAPVHPPVLIQTRAPHRFEHHSNQTAAGVVHRRSHLSANV